MKSQEDLKFYLKNNREVNLVSHFFIIKLDKAQKFQLINLNKNSYRIKKFKKMSFLKIH